MDHLYLIAGNLDPSALTKASQLLKRGANPNEISRQSDGLSPLHICCIWGNYELLKLLMLYGGDAMLKDKDGMTPLDWANREGQIECADLLRFWHYNLESSRSTPNAVRLHFVDQLKHSSSPPLRYPMSPDKENQQPKFFSNPITPSSQSFSSTPPRCLNTSSSSYSPRFFKSPIKEPLVKVKSSPARKATRLSELNGEKGITEEPELTWLCSTFSSTVSTNEPSHSSDPTWREEDDDEDYSQFSGRLSVISEEHSSGDITIVNENFNKTVKRPTTKTEKEDVKCRMSMAVCEDIFPPAANIPTPDISDNSADTSHESFEGLDIPNDIFTFVVGLTNAALKRELISRGIDVGPITQTTRLLYERKLGILLLERRSSDQLKYSIELETMIRTGAKPVAGEKDERESVRWFQDPHRSWRGGILPKSFVYLLLHPDLTKVNAKEATLRQFVDSIFYVGKGSGSRPLHHLFEAAEFFKPSIEASVKSEKIQKIMKIWRDGQGVLLLELFHHIIPAEAHTKEAAIIDAIGLNNLTNVVKGTYYGISCSWTASQQRRCGAYLIFQFWTFYKMIGARPVTFKSVT